MVRAATRVRFGRAIPRFIWGFAQGTGAMVLALAFGAFAATAQTYDLVLQGGRVMDPESGMDAVMNVGILNGSIAAISSEPLEGREVVDVAGHVVAPGFIDLHAHGQDPFSRDLQVRDGVTTALELESGAWPVDAWYAEREGNWRINFGATTSYGAARSEAFSDDRSARVYDAATAEQIEQMQETLSLGLTQGAIGVGIGLQYIPGASRAEIFRAFQTAATRGVTVFVHIRYGGVLEPETSIAAVQEMIADAAGSGASVHIVHIGSSGLTQIPMLLDMIETAHDGGVDVTTEVYPYTAASTGIQAAIFDDGWRERLGGDYSDIEWVATGERLDSASFHAYREEGGTIIAHIIPKVEMEYAIGHPAVMIASDGVGFVDGRAHPRGAGSFARVLGRYVREEGVLTLMSAIRKMTIMPADRLEAVVPAMSRKGRVSVGADADLTIFNPATVIDLATFAEPAQASEGIPHVLVAGQFVVRDGELVDGVMPGQPIRRRPISSRLLAFHAEDRASRFPRGARVTLERLSADPYPILADLRAHEPVSWVPEIGMWFVTRHADVLAVLADFETYTVDTEDSIIRDMFGRHMMTLDGPEQVRHKKQCMPMFRPKDLANTVGSSVEERVTRLIDAFAGAGAVELRAQLARPLAVETVTQILGLPPDQVPIIASWYDRFADALANFVRDPGIRARGRDASLEFAALVRSVLDSFDGGSSDSLLKRLAHTGDRLTDDEIISNALIITFGGIETTEAQLCNAVWCLLSHPDQLADVRADSALLDNAIEEAVRWQPSVQSCTRHVTTEVSLGGVDIREGEIVQCMLGAANRDPVRFDDPDRFDIRRTNVRDHVSFGSGRHFCLGASLARVEMRTAIALLLERFADLGLDDDRPVEMSGYEFRKPLELWLRW